MMAPPPGMMPRKKPRTVPRTMLHMETPQSLRVGKRFFTRAVRMSLGSRSPGSSSTSAMPKSPITTGTSPTPSKRICKLKVNRYFPLMGSMPTPARSRPTAAVIRALIMDPLLRKVSTMIPTIIRAKYSGGPNLSAIFARYGPTTVRATTAKVPAMKEPKAAMPRAGPALPLRAI